MELHGMARDFELLRDLSVAQAVTDEPKDFMLTFGQWLDWSTKLPGTLKSEGNIPRAEVEGNNTRPDSAACKAKRSCSCVTSRGRTALFQRPIALRVQRGPGHHSSTMPTPSGRSLPKRMTAAANSAHQRPPVQHQLRWQSGAPEKYSG